MANTEPAAGAVHLTKRARRLFLLQFLLFSALSLMLLLSPEISLQQLGWKEDEGVNCARWLGAALISLAYFSLCACEQSIRSPHAMAASVFILFSIFSVFVMLMAVLDQHSDSNVNTVVLLMIFLGLTLSGFYLKVTAENNSRLQLSKRTAASDGDSDSDEEAGDSHEGCSGCRRLERRYQQLLEQQQRSCFDAILG